MVLRRLIITTLAAALAGSVVAAVPARSATTALPTVTGPISGVPDGDAAYDTRGGGYSELEYFVSGTARFMGRETCSGTGPTFDKIDAARKELTPAPFKLRMIVYRPINPARFNGTVIVEWENTSGTGQGDPMFMWLDSYALREGYAYVKMMVQSGNPEGDRYATLQHPGNGYAYDIFTQELRSLRQRRGVDPLGGLTAKRIIAVGNSQSGVNLKMYLERAQPQTHAADAFLLDAAVANLGCDKQFSRPLPVPTILLLSEDGFKPEAPNQKHNLRLWEVVGSAHSDADLERGRRGSKPKRTWRDQQQLWAARNYGEEGASEHATCAIGIAGDEFPRRYAVDAATRNLDTWLRTGTPAPQPPRVEFTPSGEPLRDVNGNVVGGLRLPPITHPVASYFGEQCDISGFNVPLDPIRLRLLYPTHADYVRLMQQATTKAVRDRYLVPRDAQELMRLVRASSIGN